MPRPIQNHLKKAKNHQLSMKTKSLYLMGTAIVLMSILYACKKDNNNNNSGMSDTDLQTQSDDQTTVSNEADAVADDVDLTLSDQSTVTGSSYQPGYSNGIAAQDVHPIKSLIC